jgi:hypothetical protein
MPRDTERTKKMIDKIKIEGEQPETLPTVPSHPTSWKISGPVMCDYWCSSYLTGKSGFVGIFCEQCGKLKIICMACVVAGRRTAHECGKELVQ